MTEVRSFCMNRQHIVELESPKRLADGDEGIEICECVLLEFGLIQMFR